jgi:hypothetical protein
VPFDPPRGRCGLKGKAVCDVEDQQNVRALLAVLDSAPDRITVQRARSGYGRADPSSAAEAALTLETAGVREELAELRVLASKPIENEDEDEDEDGYW